jgi:hypothetical protein
MKKTHLPFIIVLLLFFSLLTVTRCRPYIDPPIIINEELNCDLNIKGGCFNQWVKVNDGFDNICMEPAGNYLRTLNYLTTLPASAGGPGPLTTDSTRDSWSGKYAALLITGTFSPQGTPILIPGLVGTDSLDLPNSTIILGKRYADTIMPVKFRGYYKYAPVGGDSGMVSILFSKYNPSLHKRDTIGFARQIYKAVVSNYTMIDLPINYFSTTKPDSLTLLICSSAGVNFVDLTNCKGQVGSKMWIDEIEFIMP